jgi:UDP:flavonoid glycosyltransferase YjiC (YdhE family)
MRITLIALGSRGDVLPYAALGRGLRAAGHQVLLASFATFAELAAANGLEFHPIHGDPQALLAQSAGRAGLGQLRVVLAFTRLAQDYARDLSDPRLREADVVINQLPAGLFGFDLAERAGISLILAAVMPLTRTRAFPALGLPAWPAPMPGYNAASYRIAEQIVWQLYRSTVSRWRRTVLDLPPAPFWGQSGALYARRVPVLNGFSPALVPRPADWGPHVHLTGYWYHDEPGWQPPAALERFLAGGPPPVFIGFGSMPLAEPGRIVEIVLAALRRTGRRAILHAGWGGLQAGALPDHVFPLDYAPYGWLFPRMAAVVCHGGAGTIASVARAGVPGLAVAFLFDQAYWGRRLAACAAGLPPLPFRRLAAEPLAEALERLVSDERLRHGAAALGERLRAEDSIAAARAVVEQAAAPSRPVGPGLA